MAVEDQQTLPALFSREGLVRVGYLEFFCANIRNRNTRKAYWVAAARFSKWIEERGLRLEALTPLIVAAYVESMMKDCAAPTVKQHLAAIRMLLDWFVVRGLMQSNPATSVRGPKYSATRGKTPVMSPEQVRELLASLGGKTAKQSRDLAILRLMLHTFARVGAVANLNCRDYYCDGGERWVRLFEKGGKRHEVPLAGGAREAVEAWMEMRTGCNGNDPLFVSLTPQGALTGRRLDTNDILRMIKRRAQAIGLPVEVCCHTMRATGITSFLSHGGQLERAQLIAAHSSPRTTMLYDHSDQRLGMADMERVRF